MVGQVVPGSGLALGKRQIRVSPDGWFVIGFNRDAKPNVVLEVTRADGDREQKILHVEARKYDVQRIDGLPANKVTPPAEELERIQRENALIGQARLRDQPRTDFLSDFGWPVVGRISGV